MPPATPAALPSTMQAWVRQKRGAPSNTLQLVTDLPVPDVPAGSSPDVLIRISHVALQYNSSFFLQAFPTLPFSGPWIPELEFSGEVVAAGGGAPPEVRDIGTHVIAFQTIPGMVLGHGVLAEYVRLPGSQVAPLDAAVDLAPASGVIGAGCTGLKMIRNSGVHQGHRVLVNGASGSVGSVLVQLCKLRGAYVVGVASGGNEALVRGVGADEFVDYRAHDSLPAYLAETYGDTPFDFVMDCVGTQELFVKSPGYLKIEGAMLNIGAMEGILSTVWNQMSNLYLPTWLGGVPRRYMFFSSPPLRDDAVYLAQLLGEAKIRVPVDSVFDMKNALGAYERIITKRARGKVVVKVRRV